MEQTESIPLNTLVNHWRETRERGETLSAVVKKGEFRWPTFRAGWPPTRTFDLQVIEAAEERDFRPGFLGHPDLVIYIVTWKNKV